LCSHPWAPTPFLPAPQDRVTTRVAPSAFVVLSHTPATPHPPSLSLHDALPILPHRAAWARIGSKGCRDGNRAPEPPRSIGAVLRDRKSTRLNSSHVKISYAVFCLKKKIR